MGVNWFKRDPRDVQFLLHEHLGLDRLLQYEPYRDFSRQDIDGVLQSALDLAADCLGPANQDGDRQGCVFDSGTVKLPESFHGCWEALRGGKWIALFNHRKYGGRGLPPLVSGLANEFFFGANMALNMLPLLTSGNARLIEEFGDDADKELFVPKMYSGQWAGTMCLTEPLSGSDVGWLQTSAVPDPRIRRSPDL